MLLLPMLVFEPCCSQSIVTINLNRHTPAVQICLSSADGGSKETGSVLEKCLKQLDLTPHTVEQTVLDTVR